MSSRTHIPVLCSEAIEALLIDPDQNYVDVTFGSGGHSRSILKKLRRGTLYAFDQDEKVAAKAEGIEGLEFVRANFNQIETSLHARGVFKVSGILADLGISTEQLYDSNRGFGSMHPEALLDMRMSQSNPTSTSAHLLSTSTMSELRDIFSRYGELLRAPRLARALVEARDRAPVTTVAHLKEILAPFVPFKQPARFWAQVFQSLRIAVNDELLALRALLEQAARLLISGGRLVVIAYHSLEDRLVKRFFRVGHFDRTPLCDDYGHPLPLPFRSLHKKPVTCSEEELRLNPSARSAKMRIGIKNETS